MISSSAFAAKGPNEVKKLIQTLPDAPKSISELQLAGPEQPPAGIKTPADATPTPPGMSVPVHKPADCVWYDYTCGMAYYWRIPDAYGDDFFNMRFTPGGDLCSLKTLEIVLYDAYPEFSNVSGEGISLYLWDDDMFGFPNNVITPPIVVPGASLQFYPNAVDVDIYGLGIVVDADYHFGYTVNNQTLDNFACLSDDGSCGQMRSSEFYGGMWGLMLTDWGVDVNFLMFVEACCWDAGPPGVCAWLWYDCNTTYFWTIPDAYGDDFFNMRFSMIDDAVECTLSQAEIAFYQAGSVVLAGGAGVEIYVWEDDLLGFPGLVKHFVTVPSDNLMWYPGFVNVAVPDIVFYGDYHIGYTVLDQVNEVVACLSDDGSCGQMRSSELWGGMWGLMLTDWGVDINFLMAAYQCCYVPPSTQVCYNIDYAGPAYYYWTIPDAYGDDFRNMRFTADDVCTVMTINMAFYQQGSVGNPGAEVYVWHSDGLLPTGVVTTFTVNPVTGYYPGYEIIDATTGAPVLFTSNLHVGYTPIYNNVSDVLAIVSDDGSNGMMRSSEKWAGIWGLMLTNWGIDVNFLINIDVCCPPADYCHTNCDEATGAQWPTFAHDYARTSQTPVSLGDLCGMSCAWSYNPGGNAKIEYSSPVIGGDMVFIAYTNDLVAVDLASGLKVWRTSELAAYNNIIIGNLQTSVTYDDGYVYFGVGAKRGFVKADATTGTIQWSRYMGGPNPLPGSASSTRFAPSIVANGEVYFGDDGGQIYALDAASGADIDYTMLNYGVWTSPSTNGELLFFGTSASATGGAGGVYGMMPPLGGVWAQAWYYESPFQSTVSEGYTSSPSYRCNKVFINSNYAYGNFSNWAGVRECLEAATGAEIWPDHYLVGAALYAPPATIGNVGTLEPMVFFANSIENPAGNVYGRALRAVSFSNSTIWLNHGVGPDDNDVAAHASVTCDPFVIYGTRDLGTGGGMLNIVNSDDGSAVLSWPFTGAVLGSAVARHSVNDQAYIVTATRHTNYGPGPGMLFAFTDDGIPKPKMLIPEHVVALGAVTVNDPIPHVLPPHVDAIINMGCATLTGTATINNSAPPTRVITDVNPALVGAAENLANSLVDFTVEGLADSRPSLSKYKMHVRNPGVRPAAATSSALASSWAFFTNGTATFNFAVPGNNKGQDLQYQVDRTTMNILNDNVFYVHLMSNDPCYQPENPGANPQDVIEYHIMYEYCPVATGQMVFGTTGEELYTNYGAIGDGDLALDFTLTGSDDYNYEGTMFFMTSMDDCAWNIFSAAAPAFGGYLFPFTLDGIADCGGCAFASPLTQVEVTTDGVTYLNPTGDICDFAMIDSMQAEYSSIWPHQAGPSIGLWMKYREIGTYTMAAFPQFDDFKLIVVDMTNRNATAITDLYYGIFQDWDIASGNNLHSGDVAKGYVYGWDVAEVYGHIGLPRAGSYFADGSLTDPMYNAKINSNPDEIYPPADYTPDSLFSWIANRPEGGLTQHPNCATANDQSYEIGFGKLTLAGNATHSFGFAVVGMANSVNPDYDVDELSKFINKYAGFERGDVDNDGFITLLDLVYLAAYVADPATNPGPVPFMHLGDVDNSGVVDLADVTYLANFYFYYGPPPKSAFVF